MSETFSSLGVPSDIVANLAARGILSPYPIQSATLPDSLRGADVSGRAATGSGKTIAFAIPLVTKVTKGRPKHPHALVLAPTRELAAQITDEFKALGASRGCRVASFYGGVGFGAQLSALRRGIDIAVACPGRLADLVDRREIYLDEIDIVVIDEADRMADMGFLPVVRSLLDQVNSKRQTLLFSATLDNEIDALVRRYQRDPIVHEVASDETSTSESVHHFWRAESTDRVGLTAHIVGEHGSSIVFCRTKHGVDRLARQLSQAGIESVTLHGDRTQVQRDRALASFRARKVQVLIGTDVVARGLHVDDVDCVVHFDPPEDEKAYVHRSGRTARAGKSGVVVSLITREHAKSTRTLQANLGMTVGIDEAPLHEKIHAAPGHPGPRPMASSSPKVDRSGSSGRNVNAQARRFPPRNRSKSNPVQKRRSQQRAS